MNILCFTKKLIPAVDPSLRDLHKNIGQWKEMKLKLIFADSLVGSKPPSSLSLSMAWQRTNPASLMLLPDLKNLCDFF